MTFQHHDDAIGSMTSSANVARIGVNEVLRASDEGGLAGLKVA